MRFPLKSRNGRPHRGPLLVLPTAIVAVACGGSETPAVTTVTRDSAGISIVENSASESVPVWRFAEPAAVEIGALDGDPYYQFGDVVGGVRLSDGRIVVGDGVSKQLRFYDPTGRHLLTVGGSGQGPGEFRFLFGVDLQPGDTIVGMDWPVGSSAWFDSDGGYIENKRVGPYWPGLAGHLLSDGSLLVDTYQRGSYGNEIEWWAAYGEEDLFRPAGVLVRVSPDGETTDTLLPVMGEEWFKTGKVRQDLALRQLPFARTTSVAWSDDRIYIGETGAREVSVLRFDGTRERMIRWVGDAVPVTGAERDSVRDDLLDNLRRPARRPYFERWLRAVPYPVEKPAFRALATDAAGRLWVQAWAEAGSGRDRWSVFGVDGSLIAEVDAPSGLTLLDLGEEEILAVWKDPLDVAYVRVYRLVR